MDYFLLDYFGPSDGAAHVEVGRNHSKAYKPLSSPADLSVIVCYVLISVAVGLAASRGAGKSSSSYFLAGKNSNPIVTAVSLISGITSGVSFLGMPGYTYSNGLAMLAFIPSYIFIVPFVAFVALPFFARPELQLTTSYEYLEARFSKRIRTLGAFTFIVRIIMYMGFVLYAPALALEAIAGWATYKTILVCGILATGYTCKGGMKSVIWTDFLASLALVFGLLYSISAAMHSVATTDNPQYSNITGASARMWDIAKKSDKVWTEGFWDANPLLPVNFWAMFIGFAFNAAAQCGTDQIAVQRYLATKDVADGQKSGAAGSFMNMLTGAALTFLGLALYANYMIKGEDPTAGQDPTQEKIKADQIFPYFFAHSLHAGVSGLLVSGLFATTMSVYAGGLNAATTCLIVDVIQSNKLALDGASQATIVKSSRIITCIFGVLSIVFAIVAKYIGQELSLITSVAQALCNAPTFGMFLLGMVTKRTGSRDAAIGYVVSLAFIMYCLAASFVCPTTGNADILHPANAASNGTKILHHSCHTVFLAGRISEWWYAAFGSMICVVVGLISSVVCSGTPKSVEARVVGLTWSTRHQRSIYQSTAALQDNTMDSEYEEKPLLGSYMSSINRGNYNQTL